jgi:copper chaperone NosL
MKRLILALFLLLPACKEDAPLPQPVALTVESTGYFCQMDLLGHPGPKAQIHLASFPGKPLFFSQVTDAMVYLRLPEQSDVVTVAYVSDMGAAPSWEDVGATNWIPAASAVYVIGSDAKGGMDAPEFVPFADPAKAAAFADQHGGQVVAYDQIPQSAFDTAAPAATDDADFSARLKSLSGTGG